MEWGSIIAGILSILGLLLKWWLDSNPRRMEEARNDEIEQGRRDLVDGDVAAVEQRIDRLLRATAEADNRHAGSADSKIDAGRQGAVCGMAPDGRSDGQTTGSSGTMQ